MFEKNFIEKAYGNLSDEERFEKILYAYFLSCLFLTRDDVDKIVKFYDFKFSKSKVDRLLNQNMYLINNKYYSKSDEIADDEFDKIQMSRESLGIRLLSLTEIVLYAMACSSMIDQIKNIIQDNKKAEQIFTTYSSIDYDLVDNDKIKNECYRILRLNKREIAKLDDLYIRFSQLIRCYKLYGRTIDEYNFDMILEDVSLSTKPTKNTLLSCINNEDINGLDMIKHCNNTELETDKLVDVIIDNFMEDVCNYSKEYLDIVLTSNGKPFDYTYKSEDFAKGYLYLYKENNEYKIIVPTEIKSILKSVDKDALEDELTKIMRELSIYNYQDEEIDEDDIEYTEVDNLVIDYVKINGVIENRELKKLLKKNHGIKISNRKLDIVIKKINYNILDGKYYSSMNNRELVYSILGPKKTTGVYKKCTDEAISYIEDFISDIESVCNSIKNINCDELFGSVYTCVMMGATDIEFLKNALNSFKLSKKDFAKVYDIVEKYENIISIWIYNGFNKIEYKAIKERSI